MFRSLILLVLILNSIQTSFGIDSKEVFLFSQTDLWKKSLFYQDDKSKIASEQFFFSKHGNMNPLEELEVAVKFFKENKKHSNGEYYQCLFPYRFSILENKFPGEFKRIKCSEFEKWSQDLALGSMYLVFTSSYPSNPASMFGHTFIRFDRANKGSLKQTKSLLGYSFAYQARTNPNDNPLAYTYKGLLGGYYSYLEIKPHYFNIGIYNNAESRDLWEYQIPFDASEIESFKKIAWELSHSGAFKYYFFDENCSTLLLYTLEAVRPSLNFKSSKDIFVVPQVTLREVVETFEISKQKYTASIERKLNFQLSNLNKEQKNKFLLSLKNKEEVSHLKDIKVLDLLVDYWKYKNYLKKVNLSKDENLLMYKTMSQRAKQPSLSNNSTFLIPQKEDPSSGHKLHKLNFALGDQQAQIGMRYGFHSFFDPEVGFDKKSYISFLDLNFSKDKKRLNYRLKAIDILSLNSFYKELPKISWRGSVYYNKFTEVSSLNSFAAVGLSQIYKETSFYALLGLENIKAQTFNRLEPVLNLGLKTEFNYIYLISDLFVSKLEDKSRVENLSKLLWKKNDNLTFGPVYRYVNYAEYLFEANLYF